MESYESHVEENIQNERPNYDMQFPCGDVIIRLTVINSINNFHSTPDIW